MISCYVASFASPTHTLHILPNKEQFVSSSSVTLDHEPLTVVPLFSYMGIYIICKMHQNLVQTISGIADETPGTP